MATKWPYMLLTLLTIIIIVLGIIIDWSPWITVLMAAVPVGLMIFSSVSSRRRRGVQGDHFSITSRGPVSEGRVQLRVPVSSLPETVNNAVAGMRRFKVQKISADGAEITRGITFKTWGEQITLTFEEMGPAGSKVEATSCPKVQSTAIDYGQGARDLRDLFLALRDQSEISHNADNL